MLVEIIQYAHAILTRSMGQFIPRLVSDETAQAGYIDEKSVLRLIRGFWFVGENTESSSISSILIYTYPVLSIALSAVPNALGRVSFSLRKAAERAIESTGYV